MNRRNLAVLVLALLLLAAAGYRAVTARSDSVETISSKWAASGHAAATSESFTHWNEDDPPLIPLACAKCHSIYGFFDFLGADGTAPGQVDAASATGSVLYCNVCHNDAIPGLTQAVFPSGVVVQALGDEATCLQCHQGLASTDSVDRATAGREADTVLANQTFINVHYSIAAATQMGGVTRIGYQYPDHTYVGRFEHVRGMQSCVQCHDPHSLRVDARSCSPCHSNVVGRADLRAIRGEEGDIDGDGNTSEGVYGELATLQQKLLEAMQRYAVEVLGTPIAYSSGAFPYFYNDTNGNGQADANEAQNENRYQAWTPRLLKAAYNYHFMNVDGGAFAHNPLYVMQLLYDSIEDIGRKVTIDMVGLSRPQGYED